MKAYIDTSALAAYYCPEAMSDSVERALLAIDQPYISSLTEVEMASAIARKVRCQEISLSDGHRIINLYRSHVGKGLYRWLSLDLNHFQGARAWICQFNTALKTLDALHLALAAANDLPLLSLDAQLLETARHLGIPVVPTA